MKHVRALSASTLRFTFYVLIKHRTALSASTLRFTFHVLRRAYAAHRCDQGGLLQAGELHRGHDYGRGRGRATVGGPPAELLLPPARHGPGLLDGPGDRPEPPRAAGGGVRRRRLDPYEPRQPLDAGALPAQEPAARGLRQREP